jgi:hypothetical protein
MYNREKDVYYLDHELSSIDKDFKVRFNVLYITNDDNTQAHFLFVSSPNRLINGKICPHCGSQFFNMKENYQRKFETHTAKCIKNGGKLV